MKTPKSIQDLSYDELKILVIKREFPAFRATQIFNMALNHKDWNESTNLPSVVKDAFNDYNAVSVKIIEQIEGKNGVIKYLFLLSDNSIVEGVFLPNNYGNTLCISTEVGCAMGCVFCASGLVGLIRELTAGEMLGQILVVNRKQGGTKASRTISNIVLMGSGEPLANYDNLIKFLELVSCERGINISLRNITVSTCGLADKIVSLADAKLPVNLAISLHAAFDEKRRKIMPVANLFSINEVISAADYYYNKTGRRVSYEYAMTDENVDDNSIRKLALLLKNKNVHVNLIRLNDVAERTVAPASQARSIDIQKYLEDRGISVTVRRSLGSDVEGACGQLRNHFLSDGNVVKDFNDYNVGD